MASKKNFFSRQVTPASIKGNIIIMLASSLIVSISFSSIKGNFSFFIFFSSLLLFFIGLSGAIMIFLKKSLNIMSIVGAKLFLARKGLVIKITVSVVGKKTAN